MARKRLTWYKWFDDEVHNVRAALATAIASDAQALDGSTSPTTSSRAVSTRRQWLRTGAGTACGCT